MTVQYTNVKQQTYALYQKPNKRGTPRYFFAKQQSTGATPVAEIPNGYEIYENVNGQVFLRKQRPVLIHDEEQQLVEITLLERAEPDCKFEVKGKQIRVFTSEASVGGLDDLMQTLGVSADAVRDVLQRHRQWEETLRFELVDAEARTFQTLRYCYLGSIDDWIEIGTADKLATVLNEFVPHLGQESYFELF